MKHIRKSLLCLLLVLLLAAAALTGCAQNQTATEAPKTQTEAPKPQTQTQAPETTAAHAKTDRQELGEGSKLFYFDVTFSNGETSSYAIHTDAATVGEALVGLNLIAGDDSEYGLYVKTVGGETLDYDANGMFWGFYENGEFAMTGVDSTAITDGTTYSFVASKG